MDTTSLNRLCLLGAFALCLLGVWAQSPADYEAYRRVFEAIGMTLFVAAPAFAGQLWLKKRRIYHAYTLVLAVLVVFGLFYGAASP